MEKKMTFEVDRTSVTEGDVVEVRWDCTGAERVELKIDNGFKASVIPLELAGFKRFRLHRSKGRTSLTMTAWKDGKHGSKTLRVRVRPMETTRAETVDDQGRRVRGAQWSEFQQRWKAMPEAKRVAGTSMLILGATLVVGAFAPRLFMIGLIGLLGYLVYTYIKK